MLALLLALALAPQGPEIPGKAPLAVAQAPSGAERLAALPARARIAGLQGLQSISTITFADPQARAHTLDATFVFPERARWTIAPAGGRAGERHVVYRCGQAFFELPAQAQTARLVSDAGDSDAQWRASLASVEARRALFLWPDGFEWKGDLARREAVLDGGERLVAELGPDGRPTSLSVVADRTQLEQYRAIRWRERAGRFWPDTFELALDGALLWTESVATLETAVRVLDQFFLPAELRPATLDAGPRRATPVDVPLSHVLRVPLPKETAWSEVEALWRAAFEPFARPADGGWRLEGGSCIELGPKAEPAAILLRFKPGTGPAPKDVATLREHGALAVGIPPSPSTPIDLGVELANLIRSAPPNSKPAAAFARFSGAPTLTGTGLQLYLPLEAGQELR